MLSLTGPLATDRRPRPATVSLALFLFVLAASILSLTRGAAGLGVMDLAAALFDESDERPRHRVGAALADDHAEGLGGHGFKVREYRAA